MRSWPCSKRGKGRRQPIHRLRIPTAARRRPNETKLAASEKCRNRLETGNSPRHHLQGEDQLGNDDPADTGATDSRSFMALIRSIVKVGSLTGVSRAGGFLRDILIAHALGTGPVADAFFVAMRFPNLFRQMFA